MEKNEELQNYKDKIKETKNFITENEKPTLEDLASLVNEYHKKLTVNRDFQKFKENNHGIRENLANLQESIDIGIKKFQAMKTEYQKQVETIQRERVILV